MATYTITMADNDTQSKWFRMCSAVVPVSQDSGLVTLRVDTERGLDLEAALDADDDVRSYGLED